MSELERLLTSSEDELERALLGSALAEVPTAEGLRHAALAVGLTATAATALLTTPQLVSALATEVGAATAPLAASAGTSTAATSVAATASAASLATIGKSLAGGAVLSFLALTTVDYSLQSVDEPRAGQALSTVAPAATRTQEPAPASTRRTDLTDVPASDAPPDTPTEPPSRQRRGGRGARASAPPPPVSLPSAVAAPPPPAPSSPSAADASLSAELSLLERARGALASGETSSAGELLDRYYRTRASPVLSQEAALLRVRLLLAEGKRAAAAEQARRIISTHPESAHAESLRRLAAEH